MWRELVVDSLFRPRRSAQRILAMGLPGDFLLQAAVMVACAGVVLGYLAVQMSPAGIDMISAAILGNPLIGAAAQLAIMALIVLLTVYIGRLFGGTGGAPGALALVVWLNAMMVLIQAVQLVALVLFPPLAAILAILTVFWVLWTYASFVAELHGFQNPAIVLGAVVLTSIVLFFATAMVLAILGFAPQEVS